MRLVIRGGKVFDPGSGWDGAGRDLFIENGRLVEHLPEVDQVIDARGLAVTPGAIDLRSSVAGYGQNLLRLWGGLPSPRELGESYALLGYTHIHEPHMTVATANYVHHELAAIPIVDASASLTLNLRDVDIHLKDGAQLPEVSAAWAYLLEHSRGLNFRLVEPFVRYRQDFYQHRSLSVEVVAELLPRLVELAGCLLMMEASPELLAADLPVLPGLHLGALGPDGVPVMVGKTFKGLTDELLAWQTAELLAREAGREGHVVWVRPELVVEVALDGAQRSSRYPGGVALRFARVRRYRTDKSPTEADTLAAVRALLPC